MRILSESVCAMLLAIAFCSVASADTWTRDPGGTGEICSSIGVGQVCYNRPAGVTTPAIRMFCHQATLVVSGASATVNPTACLDSACTLEVPLVVTPLTGSVPNAWVAINTPFPYVRATDDNTGVTLALVCM